MFGLFGCKDNKKKDFVFDEFKSQIESKGMKIDSVDETGLIYISKGELTLKISLDNVRRNYERDKDENHISAFPYLVQTLGFCTQLNFLKIEQKQKTIFTIYTFSKRPRFSRVSTFQNNR